MIRRSTFIELFRQTFRFDKSLKIYKNGDDNNYPELIEETIEDSVTASRCAGTVADFITGKGFGDDLNNKLVHKEKHTTLFQFLQEIAESLARHKGVFIHVNYDANYDIKDMDVLPFIDCRIGKKDDNDYNGKILLCKDWQNSKKARKAKAINVFNPDKDIVKYQVEKTGGIKKYNGQILYFKKGKYTYPLSPLHPAIKDAQSEAQAAIFKHVSLTQGFFGKTLVVTKPLVDDILKDSDPDEFRAQETERDKFKKTIEKFIGTKNSGGVLHVEMEFESDKIEDEFLIKNIESNINDKLFAHTEDSVAANICATMKVPQILVRQKDGNMFSASGEVIRQAKIFVQEQTEKDRINTEQIINKLMMRFQDAAKELSIIPLIDTNEPNNEE